MDAQSAEIIGHESKALPFRPITLGMFFLSCNLLGLIPFFETPTGAPGGAAGVGPVTWFFYQLHGFRANGPRYLKHFWARFWRPSPLMIIIEVCSHLAQILSLTVRLYANMFVRRYGDPGVLLAGAACRACDLPRFSTSSFHRSRR